MVDNMQDDNVFKVPIRINDYTDLFNSLDHRELDKREIKGYFEYNMNIRFRYLE